MLVRSGAGDAPAVQSAGGGSSGQGFVQGATALKGEAPDRAAPAFEPSPAPAPIRSPKSAPKRG